MAARRRRPVRADSAIRRLRLDWTREADPGREFILLAVMVPSRLGASGIVDRRRVGYDAVAHRSSSEIAPEPRTRRHIMGDKTPKRPPKVKKPKPAAKPPTKSA